MKCFTLGVYEKAFPEHMPLYEMLINSKSAGFDFFEISIDRTDNRINRLTDNLFKKQLYNDLEKSGFGIGSMALSALGTYTLGNLNQDIYSRGIEIFKNALQFARDFGIRIIQIPVCDVPKFDTRTIESNEKYINTLFNIVEMASAQGITIGLENMENDYADSITKVMYFIQKIDSPYLQLYPDSGNITSASIISGKNIAEDMETGKGHYLAFHLKETRPGKYGGLKYGEGHVDFNKICDIALKIGVRRFVMEYWNLDKNEWKRDLVESFNKGKTWLGCYE